MILIKGNKVKVIDDSIFPDKITEGTVGWVVEVEFKKSGITRIAFYPGGKRYDFELENTTDFEDYLTIIN